MPQLAPLPSVPPEDQYTVQTSLAVLKQHLPAFHFSQHMAVVTDGKAVGEAIRITGANLVYVRFPFNETGRPVSFTLPRAYLIPLTVRPLVVKPAIGQSFTSPLTLSMAGNPSGGGPLGGSSFAGSGVHIGGSSFANHSHVDLGLRLGDAGEPALCVVCGKWDEDAGKKRRSGHKCSGCIGQKSLARLRKEFERLTNSAEEADVYQHDDALRLVDAPNRVSPPCGDASPPPPLASRGSPHGGQPASLSSFSGASRAPAAAADDGSSLET